MKRKTKVISKSKYINKYGSATVFVSTILAAVIIVEAIYLCAVIEADRRVTVNRALKSEVETILSDYDRMLFEVYGIYGFCKGELDDQVFNKVLINNGINPDGYVEINSYRVMKSEDLKRAIASFYSYRGASVAANGFTDVILSAIDAFDSKGILNSLHNATSGKAQSVINEILRGSQRITEILNVIDNFADISNAESKITDYLDLFSSYSEAKHSDIDLNKTVNLSSITSIFELLEHYENKVSDKAEDSNDFVQHLAICHYASNNFDSRMQDDVSINRTSFTDIHFDNYRDIEYILTGIEGKDSEKTVNGEIFSLCYISEILTVFSDRNKMLKIDGIAAVMDVIVSIITLGVGLIIPIDVYKALIVVVYSAIQAVKDVKAVLDGLSVNLFCLNNVPLLEAGILVFEYKDFVFSMMLFVDSDELIERMLYILNRDFGDMVIYVELGYTYAGNKFSLSEGYRMYD